MDADEKKTGIKSADFQNIFRVAHKIIQVELLDCSADDGFERNTNVS